MSVTLSMTWARLGNSSQTFRPGTLEAMQPSSPRISTGASGLGSNVSIWLGDPYMNSRMHDFAWPNPWSPVVEARAAGSNSPACPAPPSPSPSKPKRADVQEISPGQPITEPFRTTQNANHRPPRSNEHLPRRIRDTRAVFKLYAKLSDIHELFNPPQRRGVPLQVKARRRSSHWSCCGFDQDLTTPLQSDHWRGTESRYGKCRVEATGPLRRGAPR